MSQEASADEGELQELGPPPNPPKRRRSELTSGPTRSLIEIVETSNPDQLEIIVEHWIREALCEKYERVRRFAGSGDKGRDVVAQESRDDLDPWDNFQCKRYKDPLTPSDIWIEFGKLVYWTMKGAYSRPRKYTFVCPKGCGPKAKDLLDNPEAIREGLREQWDGKCAVLCPLSEISGYLEDFEFPEFDTVEAGQITKELEDSRVYPALFGGGLIKPRPPVPPTPESIDSKELGYINALVDAYRDDAVETISDVGEAMAHEKYGEHLRHSRKEFYCAEALREFSKDVLPDEGSYRDLQEQIRDGVWHVLLDEHASAYRRVLAVCTQAVAVATDDHPLTGDLKPNDRTGICHQLANDGEIKWTK